MSTYAEFLETKRRAAEPIGPDVTVADVHPFLHPWQAEGVCWAVRQGRAALFWDCGLGKSVAQVEWARLSGRRSLIVAPLAVTAQTIREAAKVGISATYVRDGALAAGPGIWVTNYEMVDRFDPATLDAVVLDESSILKAFDGKTRTRLIEHFRPVPRRLCCTATPAPNDIAELCNHAEFLGTASRQEMLAAYFVHDEKEWRLKGHAAEAMWSWVATWAMAVRRPSDMGYSDEGYVLPALRILPHLLPVDVAPEGQLFATDLGGVGGRAAVRRQTLAARVETAIGLVDDGDQWLVWCGLNDEARAIAAAVPDAVNVEGSWAPEAKADALLAFADGARRVLVTKTSIAGFGMNFQQCARMAFVGLSDSYEAYYQAIRRCWRYGQTREVEAHIVLSELEGAIAENVARKEAEAARSMDALVRHLRAPRLAA